MPVGRQMPSHPRWVDIYDFTILRDYGNRDKFEERDSTQSPCTTVSPMIWSTCGHADSVFQLSTRESATRSSGYKYGNVQRPVAFMSRSDLGPGRSPHDLQGVSFMDRRGTLRKKAPQVGPDNVRALRSWAMPQ